MATLIHIDVETYSSLDLTEVGTYRYVNDPEFDILLLAFCIDYPNGSRTNTIGLDLVNREAYEDDDMLGLVEVDFDEAYDTMLRHVKDPYCLIAAHSAMFERLTLSKYFGFEIPPSRMRCSMINAAYAGLPLSLQQVGAALRIEKSKLETGKECIKLFCGPVDPAKNNGRTRNTRETHPDKWSDFIRYVIRDDDAEVEISDKLGVIPVPDTEWQYYCLDQEINDTGVRVDLDFVRKASEIKDILAKDAEDEIKELTGLDNPKSVKQMKDWLSSQSKTEVKSLNKDKIAEVKSEIQSEIGLKVLDLRSELSKTSLQKYDTILKCVSDDERLRGMYQHYGASRTGRTSGRHVQLQNLKRNKIKDLDEARNIVKTGDVDLLTMIYDNPSDVLSQLMRTSFIPKEGHLFAVADYSSIEARVIANLAGEQWRIELFKKGGKIYEASASMMFHVPIEQCGKGTAYRDKGKVAELALGFQGGWRAADRMQGNAGMTEEELKHIVKKWREASPAIVALWNEYHTLAVKAVMTGKRQKAKRLGVEFGITGNWMYIQIPSGRRLHYYRPKVVRKVNEFGRNVTELTYLDTEQGKSGFFRQGTYGGKLVQAVTQATARDALFSGIDRLRQEGFQTVMHTHDEVIVEVPERIAESSLKRVVEILSEPLPWFPGVPLPADGYLTKYYKKDD